MAKRQTASALGLASHYKVRVVLPGIGLWLASWDEPHRDPTYPEVWAAEWISDFDYGDSIGFIDWRHVIAVTWRYSP
jgi:hypothetical protein